MKHRLHARHVSLNIIISVSSM